MKTLYLFDIDGTLVNINKLHLASYKYDYYDVMKINVPDYMITKTFGMPDSSMHRQIFRELSINYDNAVAQRLMQLHPSNFAKCLVSTLWSRLKAFLIFLKQSAQHTILQALFRQHGRNCKAHTRKIRIVKIF